MAPAIQPSDDPDDSHVDPVKAVRFLHKFTQRGPGSMVPRPGIGEYESTLIAKIPQLADSHKTHTNEFKVVDKRNGNREFNTARQLAQYLDKHKLIVRYFCCFDDCVHYYVGYHHGKIACRHLWQHFKILKEKGLPLPHVICDKFWEAYTKSCKACHNIYFRLDKAYKCSCGGLPGVPLPQPSVPLSALRQSRPLLPLLPSSKTGLEQAQDLEIFKSQPSYATKLQPRPIPHAALSEQTFSNVHSTSAILSTSHNDTDTQLVNKNQEGLPIFNYQQATLLQSSGSSLQETTSFKHLEALLLQPSSVVSSLNSQHNDINNSNNNNNNQQQQFQHLHEQGELISSAGVETSDMSSPHFYQFPAPKAYVSSDIGDAAVPASQKLPVAQNYNFVNANNSVIEVPIHYSQVTASQPFKLQHLNFQPSNVQPLNTRFCTHADVHYSNQFYDNIKNAEVQQFINQSIASKFQNQISNSNQYWNQFHNGASIYQGYPRYNANNIQKQHQDPQNQTLAPNQNSIGMPQSTTFKAQRDDQFESQLSEFYEYQNDLSTTFNANINFPVGNKNPNQAEIKRSPFSKVYWSLEETNKLKLKKSGLYLCGLPVSESIVSQLPIEEFSKQLTHTPAEIYSITEEKTTYSPANLQTPPVSSDSRTRENQEYRRLFEPYQSLKSDNGPLVIEVDKAKELKADNSTSNIAKYVNYDNDNTKHNDSNDVPLSPNSNANTMSSISPYKDHEDGASQDDNTYDAWENELVLISRGNQFRQINSDVINDTSVNGIANDDTLMADIWQLEVSEDDNNFSDTDLQAFMDLQRNDFMNMAQDN